MKHRFPLHQFFPICTGNLCFTLPLQVYVQEVEREAQVSGTYGEKLMERLSRNLYGIKTGFISLSLWFLGALPYWILLAVVLVLGWFFYKKFAKRKGKDRRKKKE